jgi:hypothetical protein
MADLRAPGTTATKAWRCRPYRWHPSEDYIEHAATRGQARAQSAAKARDAGFHLDLTDIRAVRAKEEDRG